MLILLGALLVSYIFPLAIFFFLRNRHKEDEGYKKDCFDLLWKGLLLGFPVFGFSFVCNLIFSLLNIKENLPFLEILLSNFVLKALSEELMKYLLAKKFIDKNRARVSFLDLMSYTTISAIGFELMEAVIYAFITNPGQILVRGITSLHAFFGLTMGCFIARGYKKGSKNPAVLGIFISTLIHGLYDLCLDPIFDETAWGVLSLLIAAAGLVVNIYNFFWMRKKADDPYYNDPLFEEDKLIFEAETEAPEALAEADAADDR
ncbi:MAG: PrsW family intramembrane metalloprotease [Erysipelotrichaceae bacterium]|nr:PrsW family intramembrane metalloprotease [Erysipelotrichaceae bacterium]